MAVTLLILTLALMTAESEPAPQVGNGVVRVIDRDLKDVTIRIGVTDVKVRTVLQGNASEAPSLPALRLSLISRDTVPVLLTHLRNVMAQNSPTEFTFSSVPPGKYSLGWLPQIADWYVADIRVEPRASTTTAG